MRPVADPVPSDRGPFPDILREFDAARGEAADVAEELTPHQLWWRPDASSWSVGECLDHLVRTGEAYLVVLDEAIEEGWERGLTGRPPYRRTFTGRWIARLLEPPPGLKIPAPREIRPRRPERSGTAGGRPEGGDGGDGDDGGAGASNPAASPLPRFVALRDRLARRLRDAEGLDAGRVRVRSPFVPLLRVDLESALRLVTAHERRHLWQARRVTEDPGFPEG